MDSEKVATEEEADIETKQEKPETVGTEEWAEKSSELGKTET